MRKKNHVLVMMGGPAQSFQFFLNQNVHLTKDFLFQLNIYFIADLLIHIGIYCSPILKP